MDKNRQQDFKNQGKDQDEMRRRRNRITIQIRKNKWEETLLKRRNVPNMYSTVDEENVLPVEMVLKKLAQAAQDSSHPEEQLAAVQAARKFFTSNEYPPINDLIKTNIFPTLVDCLKQYNNTMVQYEAAWALTNVASGTYELTNQVVAAGAVPVFVQLLSSPASNVREQAVWALANIIGEGPKLRDYVIQHGVVQSMISLIRPDIPILFLCNISWFFVNLCRHKDPTPPATTVLQILPVLNALILHTDTDIIFTIVWAITYLTYGGKNQIQMVIASGVVPKLVPLLGHSVVKVQKGALRAVGSIATGTDDQTQVVLNNGALSYFPALLTHARENMRREAIWVLSNITAGTISQVQAVIDAGLLPKLIENLSKGAFETQMEAAWAIINFSVMGNRDQVFALIYEGVIGPLCALLDCQNIEVLGIVLDSLFHMLKKAEPNVQDVANLIEECNGLERIELLLAHENDSIYKLAYEIINEFFSDVGEQADLQPETTEQECAFGPDSGNLPANQFNF